VGIVGANGVGKTTLLSGLLRDRLESLPPVVVTRRLFDRVTPFYGIVDLATDFAWGEER
jgi:GTPase SAR1 family protein